MKKRVWTALPVYLILTVLMVPMSVTTFYYNRILGLIEFGVCLVSFVIILILTLRFKAYIRSVTVSAMQTCFSPSGKALEALKTPAAVCGEHGELLAYNSKFKKNFLDGFEGENIRISPFIAGFEPASAVKRGTFDSDFNNKRYTVFAREIEGGALFEFIDDTYYKNTADKYRDTKKSVALIVFDNIEDFSAEADQEAAAAHLKAEDLLYRWATRNSILLRKLGESRYIAIFDERVLMEQTDKKFKMLDNIRKVTYNGRPTTISAGIGHGCESLTESATQARKALEMALGRGGDQVAVLTNGEYVFFGGIAKGVEKTSKVKVRAVSQRIAEAIMQADQVLITGHKFSDLDSIGASAGLYALVVGKYKKQCHIVADIERTMARTMIDRLREAHGDMFVSPERGLIMAGSHTLLFIVDTHSPDFIESDHLYKNCGNVVIIDHHRRMVNAIENASIFLHEPGSSSASELVTEVIGYLSDEALSHTVAEALLAGIMLDTKNFIINTGVRTFEAAAFLRKKGADTVVVRDVFANSLENYRNKSRLVAAAQIVNHCAVTVAEEDMRDSRMVCAQAADDLLTIRGAYASFVISRIDSRTVNISARSFGKINVQLIMESLGGGGHQTMAATQLKDITLEQAKDKLTDAIKQIDFKTN